MCQYCVPLTATDIGACIWYNFTLCAISNQIFVKTGLNDLNGFKEATPLCR